MTKPSKIYKILSVGALILVPTLNAQTSPPQKDGPFIAIQACIKKMRAAQIFGDTSKDPYDSKALLSLADKMTDLDILKNFEDEDSIENFRFWLNSDIVVQKEDLRVLSIVEKKLKTNSSLSPSDKKDLIRIYKNTLQTNIKNTPKSFDLEHNFEYNSEGKLTRASYYILARNGNIYKTDATKQLNDKLKKQKAELGVFEITLPVSKKSTPLKWSLDSEGKILTGNLTAEGPLKKGIQKIKLDVPKLANEESYILFKMFEYEIKSGVTTANDPSSSDSKIRSAMKSALDFCKATIKDDDYHKIINLGLVHLENKTEISNNPFSDTLEPKEKNSH